MGHADLLQNAFGDIYINRFVLPRISSFGDTLRKYASSPCSNGASCP